MAAALRVIGTASLQRHQLEVYFQLEEVEHQLRQKSRLLQQMNDADNQQKAEMAALRDVIADNNRQLEEHEKEVRHFRFPLKYSICDVICLCF